MIDVCPKCGAKHNGMLPCDIDQDKSRIRELESENERLRQDAAYFEGAIRRRGAAAGIIFKAISEGKSISDAVAYEKEQQGVPLDAAGLRAELQVLRDHAT